MSFGQLVLQCDQMDAADIEFLHQAVDFDAQAAALFQSVDVAAQFFQLHIDAQMFYVLHATFSVIGGEIREIEFSGLGNNHLLIDGFLVSFDLTFAFVDGLLVLQQTALVEVDLALAAIPLGRRSVQFLLDFHSLVLYFNQEAFLHRQSMFYRLSSNQ